MSKITYPANAGYLLKENLISIMTNTRARTHAIAKGLSQFDLDYKVHGFINTIGTLLSHIAALESWYRVLIFENRAFNKQEDAAWKGSLPGQLILNLVHSHPLEYYTSLLDKSRHELMQDLSDKDDKWLFTDLTYDFLPFGNNYSSLFHLVEDELAHQGQMKTIIKFLNK